MMTVTLSEPVMGEYLVKTEGHALTTDICSAASALMQMLQGWLHTEEVAIEREEIGSGDCELRFKGREPVEKVKCFTAYLMVLIGFMRLASTAPDEIEVIIHGKMPGLI